MLVRFYFVERLTSEFGSLHRHRERKTENTRDVSQGGWRHAWDVTLALVWEDKTRARTRQDHKFTDFKKNSSSVWNKAAKSKNLAKPWISILCSCAWCASLGLILLTHLLRCITLKLSSAQLVLVSNHNVRSISSSFLASCISANDIFAHMVYLLEYLFRFSSVACLQLRRLGWLVQFLVVYQGPQ